MRNSNIKPTVWAPRSQRVELALIDGAHPMSRHPHRPGWWEADDSLPAGTRYGFMIDGDGPFPDPRSMSQPDGVHGLSERVDHGRFDWSDTGWNCPKWEDAVVYELHVGTFSEAGTFRSVVDHLPHLVELGITHVELMPVVEFPGNRGWGYDGVCLFAPHHAYGGPDGLKTLIDTCHSFGLGVIIDVVYNHFGPDGNYLPHFGPYFTTKYHTPWGDAPNFDGEMSSEVRSFVIDNALMWLRDYHADGLRLDAIDKIIDHSPEHLLAELSSAVRKLENETGRRRVLIAESASNDPIDVRPRDQGGHGLDAQWCDDLHHAMRTVFTGEREGYLVDYGDLGDLAKALRQGFVYDGKFSVYRNRLHGAPPGELPGHAFLGYLQNHDQVGNRATGDRFLHHPAVNAIHQKIAATLVLLGPFVPMIFMGEEWAASSPFQYFTDHQDPELARAVSEGRRREFGDIGRSPEDVPDPQHEHAFQISKLRWKERGAGVHAEMLDWYSRLLQLRQSHRELGCAASITQTECEADAAGHWLWMRRGPFLIVASLKGAEVSVPLPCEVGRIVIEEGRSSAVPGAREILFRETGIIVMKTR